MITFPFDCQHTFQHRRYSLINREIAAFLELVQAGSANGRRPLHDLSIAHARAEYEQSSLLLDSSSEALNAEHDVAICCRDGRQMSCRLYIPLISAVSPGALPALLYFHGGGYCVGGLESHSALCRALAARTRCIVLAAAYRLAPEHKFPTAFEDAEDAYLWLLRNASSYNIDLNRIAVGGDSAGGTLATTLCLAVRDRNCEHPAAQVLLYPCTSSRQDSDSHQRYAQGYLLEAETLQWMFNNYLRSDADRTDWRFGPLNARELSGLPPAYIALAEYDPLVDEGVAYANRLKASGVETQLKIYEGMIHDFARLGNIVPEAADQVRTDMAEFLTTAFVQ